MEWVAGLAQGLIVRYGGQTGYRGMIPFFLGLVLGDYLTGTVWAIASPALNFQGYQIFH